MAKPEKIMVYMNESLHVEGCSLIEVRDSIEDLIQKCGGDGKVWFNEVEYSPYGELQVSFIREETDAEYEKRVNALAKQRREQLKINRLKRQTRDRKEYERLKKKFEPEGK